MTYPERRLEVEELEIMIRNTSADFHSGMISPQKYTAEVIKIIELSIAQAVAEERERVVGEIEGMKNKKHVCESREGWGCEYETAIDDLLSSLSPNSSEKVGEINNEE